MLAVSASLFQLRVKSSHFSFLSSAPSIDKILYQRGYRLACFGELAQEDIFETLTDFYSYLHTPQFITQASSVLKPRSPSEHQLQSPQNTRGLGLYTSNPSLARLTASHTIDDKL